MLKSACFRGAFALATLWSLPSLAANDPVYGPTENQYRVGLNQMFAVAEHLRLGGGDVQQAARWYHRAADAGDARAMAMLGWLHRTGTGVTQDYGLARGWYAKAYAEGYREPWVVYGLGWLTLHGVGGDRSETEGHDLILAAARDGYAGAMYHAGWNFEEGRGAQRDYETARRWYERAAAAGNAEAMTRLANLYYKGRGVRQDFGEAYRHYRQAAAAGQADAMYNLGLMAQQGIGIKSDAVVAARWFAEAAVAGHAEARVALGRLNQSTERVTAAAASTSTGWWGRAVTSGQPSG